MSYTRQDYDFMAMKRRHAFVEIASSLGKDHPVTQMMGSLAWGRHDAEQGPHGSLRSAIREMSFLDGYFSCLNKWALENDRKAQRIMLEEYPRGFESARSSHPAHE